MMKTRGSPILVLVGSVLLGGWSARAEPPAVPRSDEVTQEGAMLAADEVAQEDGSKVRGVRTPSPEPAKTDEPELQEDHEAVHPHDSGTHAHSADVHQHDSARHQHDADTNQQDSGMGGHARTHELGRMGGGAQGGHGGRMSGGH